jgi:hypothetical protein
VELASDVSTVRRHLGFKHKGVYHNWCKTSGFLSMLEEDKQARKKAEEQKKQALMQSTLIAHIIPIVRSQITPYTDANLAHAIAKWKICMDKVRLSSICQLLYKFIHLYLVVPTCL